MIGQLFGCEQKVSLQKLQRKQSKNTFFQSDWDLPVDSNHLFITFSFKPCSYPCHKISGVDIAKQQRFFNSEHTQNWSYYWNLIGNRVETLQNV